MTRPSILFILLTFYTSTPAFAESDDALPNLLPLSVSTPLLSEAEAIEKNGFPSDQVRFVLIDESAGRVLRSNLEDRVSIPASVTKLSTALRAADHLGLGSRPQTRVLMDSAGGLYLQGGGDVALDPAGLEQLADDAAKIAPARPRTFVLDDTRFERRSLISPVFDPTESDNPGVGALALRGNVYALRVRKTENDFETLTADQTASFRTVRNENASENGEMVTRDPRASGDLWRLNANAVRKLLVNKPVGAEVKVAEMPMRDAGMVAAELFARALRARGVNVPDPVRGATPSSAQTLAVRSGPEFSTLLRRMLEVSDNAYAETFGLLAQATTTEKPAMPQAAAGMATWMRGLAPEQNWDGFRLVNSSGLTTDNLVSPQQMASFLRAALGRADLAPVFDLLKRTQQENAVLRAKTGSLNYVRALAGSLRTTRDSSLVLTLFINDPVRRAILNRGPGTPGYKEASENSGDWNERSLALRGDLVNLWSKEL